MTLSRTLAALAASFAVVTGAMAEDVVAPPAHTAPATTKSDEAKTGHSWELPALTVTGTQTGGFREEDRIGSYGQPRWTARRLFTETRTYVIPEGQIEFEYWLIVTDKRDDEPSQVKQVYELEMGLPYRFQLDLYQTYVKEGSHGAMELDGTKFELRWALADWDVIPLNPTLYAEWEAANNGYDHAEGKLLLCDEIVPRVHYGVNFVYEQELGGEEEIAREITGGISYAVKDEKFAIGAECKFAWTDTNEDRGEYEKEQLVGPTAQFRPAPQMHVDASYLFGLNDDSPKSKTAVIIGWEF